MHFGKMLCVHHRHVVCVEAWMPEWKFPTSDFWRPDTQEGPQWCLAPPAAAGPRQRFRDLRSVPTLCLLQGPGPPQQFLVSWFE